MTVDELQVLITANTTALQKEIAKTNSTIASLKKSADKTQGGVTSAFKKLKTGIVALGIGKVIKDSIQLGMDAIESDNLFEVSMGNMADSVRDWSEEVGNALGLSATEMRKNVGTIYNMTTSMGLAEDNALKMSKGITLLANDMASFYNLSTDEAFNKINAGITGETEPLKRLGILVDENTVKQVAYQQGIAETGTELTQQQKVLARYVAILQQTGNAQGDLARTLDSPANQLRQLKSQVQNLGIAFGSFLTPMIQAVIPYVTAFTKVITYALNTLSKFLGLKSTSASDETAKISNNIGGIGSGLDDANKKAKNLKGTLAGFDEMNVLQDNSSDSGSSGSGGTTSAGLDFDLGDYDAHLDGLTSKVDEIVEQIKTAFMGVKDVVSSIWASEPIQAFVGAVTTYGQFLWDYWSTLGMSFIENATTTWGNIEGNVTTILTNITTLWTKFWTDINAGIQTWGQPIIKGVDGVFNTVWTKAIDPYLQLITKAWADFSGILVELWDKHGKPLIDNIGEFVVNIIELFQKVYDDVIDPIVTPFLEMLSWLWDKHLKALVKEVGDFVGTLINDALEIYNKFIDPIVKWLLDFLSPAWAFLSSLIIDRLGTAVSFVVDRIKNILQIFRGLLDFITGIFTGNWSKAWDGVKTIFKGFADSLSALFKAPINWIIDGINAFIRGLNKIKIPDWVPAVGGKGFHIDTLPKLARGGIVDRPTTAIIGEAGREAVVPLDRDRGAFEEIADRIAEKMDGGGQPTQIIVKLGEDTIFDKFIDNIKERNFESNGEVFV